MDTIDLIVRSKNGDKEAREKVITENIGLVWSIVKRFMGRGYELEDLYQIGSIGLIKAIKRFDVNLDVQLSISISLIEELMKDVPNILQFLNTTLLINLLSKHLFFY